MQKPIRHIRHGARPTRIKHTDYDFIKSHNFGDVTATQTQFDDEYFADAGLTMPDQNVPDTEFVPATPAMPWGCTDFGSAEITTDLTEQVHNPIYVEAITHANENHGCDIRVSLDACTPPTVLNPHRLGWIKQYFNIRASGALDYFDTFRLAQLAGVKVGEKRSITWGTPWFPSWEAAVRSGQTIMPMPTLNELNNVNTLPWHDSKLDGWTTKNGSPVYRDKSWQGNQIGDRGFLYFPREVINVVMAISGTVAFTATNKPINAPLTIDVTTLQWLISVLQGIVETYLPFLKK